MSDENLPAIDDRTIGQYLSALGSEDPTPGGGSASGLVGALGSTLGLMAIALTDLDDTEASDQLREARSTLEHLQDRFTGLAQQDESAYRGYRNAAALPKGSDEEKSVRKVAMQEALKAAAGVPMAMCEASAELAEALITVRRHGNRYLASDTRVAGVFAGACFAAARILADTNLAMIKDEDWVEEATARLDTLARRFDTAITNE